ncbi:MAG: TonB-dependent receptor plug domain-containing protein [Gammaproteobacteria bacterium]|nr:TonB-dependent receptor plug domain-containing protein [Gammaproteobacteria bacterium]
MLTKLKLFKNCRQALFAFMPVLLTMSYAVDAALLEEVVVTAQKREQNLQDVGVSVTAFTGGQIRELGYTNTIDIAAQTPGLGIIQFHPTLTTVNIRGISQNDFADHLEPPIAMYVDETYVSAMGAGHAQLYDLERVEVLRGPQGTLFGRNATGGLMHYISAAPTEENEGFLEFTYGSYDQKKFQGAISGSLTENLLGRLSFAGNFHDGVAENRIGPDLRETEHYALRGQLEYRASEDVTLKLKVHHAEDDSLGNAYTHTPIVADADGLGINLPPGSTDFFGYVEPDNDPFTGSYDFTGYFKRAITGITGKLEWDLGGMTLTSITDYLNMNKNYGEDTEGSPNPVFVFVTDQDFEQFSQEIRLSGEAGDNLRWTGGLYYLDIEHAGNLDYFLDLPFAPPNAFNDPANFISGPTSNTVNSDSWAIFGHMEYDFNDQWSMIAALRYTEDDRKLDFVSADVLGGNFTGLPFTLTIPFALATDPDFLVPGATTPSADLFNQSFNNVSAKFQIDWRPSDDTLLFASFNRGHKAGNARLPAGGNPTAPLSTFPHDEEVLHSWELGIKTTFWDGKAQLNATGFYYDYKDYQGFIVVPGVIPAALSIVNLDAEAVGGEIELILQPTERLGFRFGASFEDSEVKDVELPSGRLVDNDLPYAPSFTLSGLARYEWPAFNGTMAMQADFNYSDDYCFSVLCAPLDKEDDYIIGNFRMSYTTSDERWSVAAFVNNVSDTHYRLYTLDISGLGIANDAYANPRWAGGTISYNWK